ncbi:MAG: hypothetical protein DMG85_05895 [Acidobacteria bacterium]|nr:MAG: hypothetical protein DMG85_05895 [Acidobacteriota bacterium]
MAWDPTKDGKSVIRASYGLFYDHPLLALAFDSDVADASQAPQIVLFPGAPGKCSLNASNAFQGLLSCLPPAFNYLPNEQRFNPAPNAPSIFVGQAYLNPTSPVPLAIQPFGFPVAKNFQYGSSQQANLTYERQWGHDLSLGLEYNFNGGRHLNRPININANKSQFLIANWQAAVATATALGIKPSDPNFPSNPLAVGTQNPAVFPPCGGASPSGPFYVPAALVSFFRPSGFNPSLMGVLAPCVPLARQILQTEGLMSNCDATTLANCVPFSDMPANFSSGSSVYHGFTANLKKRFGQHYEFLGSYTWSHTIDDSTDLQSPLEPQNNYNLAAERSNSLFDQRHRFVFSGVYQSGTLSGGFWSKFFSGWTLAPIIEAASGRPFNIITGDDRNFDFSTPTDRPLIVAAGTGPNSCGDVAAASRFSPTGFLQPACFLNGTLDGNLGRNAGTKPMNVFTDIRVGKRIPLGERVALEGLVDAFNFINRFNVADVNPLWDSGQQPTAAFDPRQLQFALKLTW